MCEGLGSNIKLLYIWVGGKGFKSSNESQVLSGPT